MQKPVLFSVSFHVLLVGAMWITIPDFFDDKEIKDKPIIVEIVSVDKDITSLESKRKNPKKTKGQIEEAKPIIKSKPASKPIREIAENQSSEVVELNESKQKPVLRTPPKKENLLDQTKLKPKLKPRPPKKKKDFDASRISLLIDKSKKDSKDEENKDKKEDNFLTKPKVKKDISEQVNKRKNLIKNAKISSRLTMRDIDLIRYQIERNWTPPSGARDAIDLIIKLRIVLNLDGSLRGAPVVVNSGRLSDNFFRAAADSAIRAVYKAQPFTDLPKAKYDAWRDITLTFNPKQLLGG